MNILKTAAAGLALVAAIPASADTTVGNNDTGNCFPFACFASNGGQWYQQVFAASAFSGPITIDALRYARTSFAPATYDTASYSVSFYLTDLGTTTLTTDRVANRGALLGTFGNFSLSGNIDPTLTLDGANFRYDPTLGNLLLDLSVTGFTSAGTGFASFGADTTRDVTSRAYSLTIGGVPFTTPPVSLALSTTFLTASGGVPEPATWALMIAGFGAVGATLRRRRAGALRHA